jgi:D-xylose transport system ATP-binding protein
MNSMKPPVEHPNPFLELRGIHKRYGGVNALRGVDLTVNCGEVVALVGDNGAGKSTLIKIIAGVIGSDEGVVRINGEAVSLGTPHAAALHGIAAVYQDLALCENLDVVANLFLGMELTHPPLCGRLRRLREPEMLRIASEALVELGANIPSLRRPVSTLSGGQRQAIAVARARLSGSKLVIFDEPTAALGVRQTEQVLKLIQTLAKQGQAVILISHNLQDAFSVADRIVVLRLGSNAGGFNRSEFDGDRIVTAMIGVSRDPK